MTVIISRRRIGIVVLYILSLAAFFHLEIVRRWDWPTVIANGGCVDPTICRDSNPIPTINIGNQMPGPGIRPDGPYKFANALATFPLVVYLAFRPRDEWRWQTMAALLLGGYVIPLYWLNDWSQLCNYRNDEMQQLCSWSVDIIAKMNRDVGYGNIWLINGTLLAAMRNQSWSNYMIVNDHDLDVCFNGAVHDKILSFLRRNGHFFQSQLQRGNIRKLYIYPSFIRPYTGHSGPLSLDMEECPVEPLREITGCDRARFNVSINAERHLISTFGSDWHVPAVANHWLACSLFWWA